MRSLFAAMIIALVAGAAWAEDAPAPADAVLQRDILGSWAPSEASCTSGPLVFSPDGTYAQQGAHPTTGKFQIKDGKITDSGNGGIKTMAVILQSDSLKFMDERGTVALALVRCAATAPALPKPQPDAELQRLIVGAWAEKAADCETGAVRFTAEGTISIPGVQSASGTYKVKDGTVTTTPQRGKDAARIVIDGDTLTAFGADGKIIGKAIRCVQSSDKATTPSAPAVEAPVVADVRVLVGLAVAEQRIFLNCSRTDPVTYDLLSKSWQRDVDKARELLAADPDTSGYVPEFLEKTATSSFMMDKEPFSKVIALCESRKDWQKDVNLFRFTILSLKLPKMLQKP